MKTSGVIIIVIISLILGFFIARSCEEPDYPDYTEELEAEKKIRQELIAENIALENKIDSLKNVIPEIKYKTVYIKADIDSSIAEDSTNAIPEYRNQLVRNNELPEGTEMLTFREIGLGTKLMSEIPQLKLEVKTYEDMTKDYDKVIDNCKLIKKSYNNTIDIKEQEVERWKLLYQGEQSFWKQEWFWFAIGVVATLTTVWATGKLK